MLTFRILLEADFQLAENLLSRCFDKRPPYYAVDQKNAILAFKENQLAGLSLFWRNELHDKTVVEYISVLPEFRRQGIGTLLHEELRKAFPFRKTDVAVDMSCDASDIRAQSFMKSLGFRKYLDCYMNTINVHDLDLTSSSKKIITLDLLYENEVMVTRVRDFHTRRYDEDHQQFLPVTANREVRLGYFDDGDHKFGVAMFDGSKMIGCSLAFLNMGKRLGKDYDDIVVLNAYADGESLAEEAERIKAMYSYQVELLKKNGQESIYIEFDSTERTSSHMLGWMPSKPEVMERYQISLSR